MVVASLELLRPEALLLVGLALVPIGVLAALARRHDRAARTVGLEPASRKGLVAPALLTSAACAALGLAAAQPVWTTTSTRLVRTESELMVVVDVSRSMLASPRPGAATRLERARNIARRLRAAAPGVPAGVSGLTDRVLPYAFPTADPGVFEETLDRSATVDAPPPQQDATVATTFSSLPALTTTGFFSRQAKRRTCVLVTDGETRAGDAGSGDGALPSFGGAGALPSLGGASSGAGAAGAGAGTAEATALAGDRGCRLVVVRVGDDGERIFGPNGAPEAEYRPEASAPAVVEELAEAAEGEAFSEAEIAGAAAVVRRAAEVGPARRLGAETTITRLAPYCAGAAAILVLVFLGTRVSRRWLPRGRIVASA